MEKVNIKKACIIGCAAVLLLLVASISACTIGLGSEVVASRSSSGTDWWKLCQQAHTFLGLQTPCDQLVNSDNTLTPLGNKVLYCYAGGALLGLLGGLESLGPGKALGDAAGCPK